VNVHTPGYVQLKIEFDFIAVSMENNEDFWIQYYTGSAWVTPIKIKYPADFTNGVFYAATVNIFESQYNFPTNMKLRFACDASANDDDVYIDNVKITGFTSLTDGEELVIKEIRTIENKGIENMLTGSDEIRIYPNPASSILNISMPGNQSAEIYLYNLSGKVVYHEITTDAEKTIDLTELTEGLYILSVSTTNTYFTKKVIKN
jgi:hypothetical protein